RAVPRRPRAARARGPGCVRHALPAGAPGRGDHRRRALRRPVRDLGRGREPAARAEGPPYTAPRRLMIALFVDIKIDPSSREQFLAAIKTQQETSLALESGCKRFDICEDIEDPDHFILYEMYVDETAFRDHRQTPHFARWSEARTTFVTQ